MVWGIHAERGRQEEEQNNSKDEGVDNAEAESRELEVRWMASGITACSVSATVATRISEIKSRVRELVGIPLQEQRLFQERASRWGPRFALRSRKRRRALASQVGDDPRVSNLAHFHQFAATPDPIPAGKFTQLRLLSRAQLGDVFEYEWRRYGQQNGERVAVKRVRNSQIASNTGKETDERRAHLTGVNRPDAEDAKTEIGVLTYLSQQVDLSPYLLRMEGAFAEGEHTLIVMELADGGELFDVVASAATVGKRLEEGVMRRYTWQLLQAAAYLHKHYISHRDISLENVLLKAGKACLMDFGMAVS
eukprot:CAMPEP_0170646408 /NCGR_PEP_ID=MMETSP0224-20130122/43622_1 /TAXON_ID=285029 /ORGANISM="Togula jolla, Strain CCCM 725" /LENGTH=306 /DNA_ID=CAMNT_0010977739 /DNA_START=71 /DNA_END=988 /DNA_ORIENTATION=+